MDPVCVLPWVKLVGGASAMRVKEESWPPSSERPHPGVDGTDAEASSCRRKPGPWLHCSAQEG